MKFIGMPWISMSLRFIINMKITKYILKGTLVIFAWASVTSGFAQEVPPAENPGFVVDKIIAKVDNYIVIKSELERSVSGLYHQWRYAISGSKVSVSGYAGQEQAHVSEGGDRFRGGIGCGG